MSGGVGSASGAADGAGVGVVCARAGGGFSLSAAALRGVLRADLRALPVAVLSVAGATRGGKSFLLDFCLRYLKATPEARSDGSWLGADDEPLKGFSWRGGCDRDTIGIQIWSEPFVLMRQNGEKVVVLLMDTQGTFDSRSTVRDSTTIFAMSTLLSSVQVFNISRNIQEDHLQYLQLFTEYAKLAKEECETPFQDLLFLVRDWSYAYQHALGAQGGQDLMDKRLQIDEDQAEELKEVRQHILASFESVRCFLMPHPGLAVATSPDFKGCLSDISPEFKDALLELIPGLFKENLTLKKVNGQEIQLQELAEYFESYMETFNSDQMPTPVSILKATSAACLEAARSSARALYEGLMTQGGVGEGVGVGEGGRQGGRSCPRGALLRRHADAVREARDAFLKRRTLAAPERAAETLDLLIQELNGWFTKYDALNDANTQATVSDAKAAYTKLMLNITECLLLSELEERHLKAVDAALALFDHFRLPAEPDDEGIEEDEDRSNLQTELHNFLDLYDEITKNNEANIDAAMAVALEKYEDGVCQGAPLTLCVHPENLTTLHTNAMETAKEEFRSNFKSQSSELNDVVATLISKIYRRFIQLKSINEDNNAKAVDTAIKFYENNMKYDILNDGCLHPLDLHREHDTLYRSTMTAFNRSRSNRDHEVGRDNHKLKLIREITGKYKHFILLNENMNNDAVKCAHESYLSSMRTRNENNAPAMIGVPDFELFRRHKLMKPQAINRFYGLRKTGQRHAEDKYRDELIKLIDRSYAWSVIKFFGTGSISFATIFFFRRLW